MKELEAILNNVEVSKPIFKIEIEADPYYRGKKLHFKKQSTLTPNLTYQVSDVLAEALSKNIREVFSTDLCFRVDMHKSMDGAKNIMRTWIAHFLNAHIKSAHPTATKLYKFYERHAFYGIIKLDEALIKLYKYGKQNEKDVFNNTVHTQNVMSILELLKTKQEKGTL